MEKKIGDVENKVPEISGLATTIVLNRKIREVEKKIPDISGLATATVLNAKAEVENKIPNHDVYITTHEFDNLKAENFKERLKNQIWRAKMILFIN